MQKAIILDADNTLWKLQVLYDRAREELLSFLEVLGADRNIAFARSREYSITYVQKINPQTGKKYLYTAARLPAIFEATLLSFFPDAPEVARKHVRTIAEKVFREKAEPMEGIGQLLHNLKEAGYKLFILTKGEYWVQQKRLKEFDYINLIDDTIIVEDKTAETFSTLAARHNIDVSRSFSIGDSVKADIIPANAAGLNTILLQSHTWAPETEGAVPVQTVIVGNLEEIFDIVLRKENNMPEKKSAENLQQRLRGAWSAASGSDPERWSANNPAWGQCAVTACAVQDELGGEIVWAEAILPDGETVSHYFNIINGQEVDYSGGSFRQAQSFRKVSRRHASLRQRGSMFSPLTLRVRAITH